MLVVFACVVVALSVGVMLRTNEPSDKGKTLTQWMEVLDDQNESSRVIFEMGTNALPHLVSRLAKEDSRWKRATAAWLSKHNWLHLRLTLATDRHGDALHALEALQPERFPKEILDAAVAKLSPLLTRSTHAYPVAQAMLLLGTNSIPALIDSLSGTNQWARICSAIVLEKLNLPAEQRGIPFAKRLTHYGGNGIKTVGFTFSNDDWAGLEANFKHTNWAVRRATAEAMGFFFSQGDTPTGDLKRLLKDSDAQVRVAARDALKRINPAEAASAGIQ